MITIRFNSQTDHRLLGPIFVSQNRITLYIADYSDNIDYSNGFQKWILPRMSKIDESARISTPQSKMIQDFSAYKYKWNVLTPMTNGIVLTTDPNNVETEVDHFHPYTDEELRNINEELDRQAEEAEKAAQAEQSAEERISALEAELAELKASLK